MVATVWAESIPYWSTASNVAVLSLERGDQVWLLLLSRASYLHGYMYTTFSGSIVFELQITVTNGRPATVLTTQWKLHSHTTRTEQRQYCVLFQVSVQLPLIVYFCTIFIRNNRYICRINRHCSVLFFERPRGLAAHGIIDKSSYLIAWLSLVGPIQCAMLSNY